MSLAHTPPLYGINNRSKGKGAAILNSKCAKYSSISMLLNTSKSANNPERLNREIMRIESRVKSLENEACSLRNLVPFRLKDMVDQMKQDINLLQTFYSKPVEDVLPKSPNGETIKEDNENSNNIEVNDNIRNNDSEANVNTENGDNIEVNDNTKNNENIKNNDDEIDDDNGNAEKEDSVKIDLDEELKEIQKRVMSRLNNSLESSIKLLIKEKENKNTKQVQNTSKSLLMKRNLFDLEEDYLNEVQQRVENSTNLINDRNSHINDRIKAVQDKASKLYSQYFVVSKNDVESMQQKLKAIEDDCSYHRSEIFSIKSKINAAQQNILSNSRAKNVQKVQIQSSNEKIEKRDFISSIQKDLPPNLKNQIEELKQETINFTEEFQNSLIELKKEADQCEDESQELSKSISSISASTETIESNANKTKKLVHELQEKMNEISSKIEQQDNEKALLSIVEQIRSTNEKIAEEIKEMKKKISISNGSSDDENENEKDED